MFDVSWMRARHWIFAFVLAAPIGIVMYACLEAKMASLGEEPAKPTWTQELVTTAWAQETKWYDRSCGPDCVEFNSMSRPMFGYDGTFECELANSEHPEVCSNPSPVEATIVCITDLEVWDAAGRKDPRSRHQGLRKDLVTGNYRLERNDVGAGAGEHCSVFLSWPHTGSRSSIFLPIEELLPDGP